MSNDWSDPWTQAQRDLKRAGDALNTGDMREAELQLSLAIQHLQATLFAMAVRQVGSEK